MGWVSIGRRRGWRLIRDGKDGIDYILLEMAGILAVAIRDDDFS